ncbi:hypothetical protein NBRC3280_3409 [Acetobacter pasteurianus NBRC 3280]|uniref:Uncharacterized protein n=1 Tax=Acetobacter pasteurianus NBRC 3278 TaxID=1226660 RepID=A0A401X9N1_ACEPA|nr:hypothetical protein [Acetobacter pasteurianus]GCD60855.1 hypothetical protein NBRC3277_3430 [Acetobacter pasteurianus NBRC 3277]GCD64448.1 hypothetical protein NBRC3278_3541 [Acetobacter pasteurianus NBRC 3278]GCD70774.1 hypothetical protein NBRC3280_3409 [Acetobacter pasteurianus NBRC 3280]
MTEPDSLRRGGKLPRDREGYDVGTVRDGHGNIIVRRHGPQGDEDWGIMRWNIDLGEYIFESSNDETAASDGISGDEAFVFGKVVINAGGTLPCWIPE